MIWSDSFLTQLAIDAEQQINQAVPCIFNRFFLQTQVGLSVYTLPSFVRTIRSISWLGRKLDPLSFEEMQLVTPATAFEDSNNQMPGVIGKPLYWIIHPTGAYDIRLYPTPNLVLTGENLDPYSPLLNEQACTVTCMRLPDTTFSDPTSLLPPYIDRYLRKAYVLWKAYEAEGKGQHLQAASYYKQKFEFLIENFRSINEGCFISKRYSLDSDGILNMENFKYPKPFLPSNFERIIFR